MASIDGNYNYRMNEELCVKSQWKRGRGEELRDNYHRQLAVICSDQS